MGFVFFNWRKKNETAKTGKRTGKRTNKMTMNDSDSDSDSDSVYDNLPQLFYGPNAANAMETFETNYANILSAACADQRLDALKWLVELRPDLVSSEMGMDALAAAVVEACRTNLVSEVNNRIILWVYEQLRHRDIRRARTAAEIAFEIACRRLNIELAVVFNGERINNKDNCATNQRVFCAACANGHLDMAVWIRETQLQPDIGAHQLKTAAWMAAKNGFINVVLWLIGTSDLIDDASKEKIVEVCTTRAAEKFEAKPGGVTY